MKFEHLQVLKYYKIKIGREWQLALLMNKREQFNLGKENRDKEVIFRTLKGNEIYRSAGQIRSAEGT